MLFPLGIDFQNRGFESCLVDSDPGIHALVDGFQHSTIRHSYSSAQEPHRTNRSGNKQHPSNKTTEQQNNNSNNEGKGGAKFEETGWGRILSGPHKNHNPPHNPAHRPPPPPILPASPPPESQVHAKRPQARHHGDESPEGEPHDAEGPVRGIPESVEEDFAERLRGTVVP